MKIFLISLNTSVFFMSLCMVLGILQPFYLVFYVFSKTVRDTLKAAYSGIWPIFFINFFFIIFYGSIAAPSVIAWLAQDVYH